MNSAKVSLALTLIAEQRFYNLTSGEFATLGIAGDLSPYFREEHIRNWCVKIILDTFTEAILEPSVPDQVILTFPDAAILYITDVTFTWDASEDADYYEIQVDDTDDTFASLAVDETGITELEWVEAAMAADTYYVRVRGVNEIGIGEWSDVFEFELSVSDAPAITAPEEQETLVLADVTFTWSEVDGAVTYELQVDDTDNTFASLVVDESGLAVATHEEIAMADDTYFARVRAVNPVGDSAWSTVVEFTVNVP